MHKNQRSNCLSTFLSQIFHTISAPDEYRVLSIFSKCIKMHENPRSNDNDRSERANNTRKLDDRSIEKSARTRTDVFFDRYLSYVTFTLRELLRNFVYR